MAQPLLPVNESTKVPISEAVRASIQYVMDQPEIGFPDEKTHHFAYSLKEVEDDTDYSREKSVTVNNQEFLFMIARKTINYAAVRVYHCPIEEKTIWDKTAGYYKLVKTVLCLGTDRLLNCMVCRFGEITTLSCEGDKKVMLYSSTVNPWMLGAVSILGVYLYPVMVDVIDIHDATWDKHQEALKQREEQQQQKDLTAGAPSNPVPESAPVNPPAPSTASAPMTGPGNDKAVAEELPSAAAKV